MEDESKANDNEDERQDEEEDEEEEEEEEAWAKSKSKAILRAGILSGEITPDMKPKFVFGLNKEEHQKWVAKSSYDNWRNGLLRLRKALGRDSDRMLEDCLSYGHDLAIVQKRRPAKVPWHRSGAARRMKEDINDSKQLEMEPKELYEQHEEYKAFDLTEVRKHIYQEVDSRPKRAIRFEKKKATFKYPELHKNHPRLQSESEEESE